MRLVTILSSLNQREPHRKIYFDCYLYQGTDKNSLLSNSLNDMETDLVSELHVANRNNRWEVFFPFLQDPMYASDTAEAAPSAWPEVRAFA